MTNIQIINLKYLKSIEEVDKHLVAHREYLDEGYKSGKLLMSGRKDPLTGGIIVAKFDSVWDAQEFMKNDPFIKNTVAEFKITQFNPVKYDDRLKEILGIPDLKSVK
jgi:uncharacterized protein YciI